MGGSARPQDGFRCANLLNFIFRRLFLFELAMVFKGRGSARPQAEPGCEWGPW